MNKLQITSRKNKENVIDKISKLGREDFEKLEIYLMGLEDKNRINEKPA